MTDHHAYAAVIADLTAQRDRIDNAIFAIRSMERYLRVERSTLGALNITGIEEVPVKVTPPRDIPTDPEILRATATHMLNSGSSMNEVKTALNLTQEQADQFFFGK